MTAPTHVVAAMAGSIFAVRFFEIALSPVGFLFLILGSLFPDIDGGGVITRPGTIFKNFLNRPLVLFFDFLASIFSEIFRKLTGHRGFFHWLIWPVALLFVSSNYSSSSTFWFAFGYLSHVFIDSLTPLGVPLLAPISRKKYNLLSIKTGSSMEFLVFACCLLYSLIFCWELLPEGAQQALRKLYENL